ncbi:unnamed protein product [Amoebophrya sp. A120]|nr:unnamed protein product [Amoebophrya sp. A120]|eukprot:GSA120T00010184001.1
MPATSSKTRLTGSTAASSSSKPHKNGKSTQQKSAATTSSKPASSRTGTKRKEASGTSTATRNIKIKPEQAPKRANAATSKAAAGTSKVKKELEQVVKHEPDHVDDNEADENHELPRGSSPEPKRRKVKKQEEPKINADVVESNGSSSKSKIITAGKNYDKQPEIVPPASSSSSLQHLLLQTNKSDPMAFMLALNTKLGKEIADLDAEIDTYADKKEKKAQKTSSRRSVADTKAASARAAAGCSSAMNKGTKGNIKCSSIDPSDPEQVSKVLEENETVLNRMFSKSSRSVSKSSAGAPAGQSHNHRGSKNNKNFRHINYGGETTVYDLLNDPDSEVERDEENYAGMTPCDPVTGITKNFISHLQYDQPLGTAKGNKNAARGAGKKKSKKRSAKLYEDVDPYAHQRAADFNPSATPAVIDINPSATPAFFNLDERGRVHSKNSGCSSKNSRASSGGDNLMKSKSDKVVAVKKKKRDDDEPLDEQLVERKKRKREHEKIKRDAVSFQLQQELLVKSYSTKEKKQLLKKLERDYEKQFQLVDLKDGRDLLVEEENNDEINHTGALISASGGNVLIREDMEKVNFLGKINFDPTAYGQEVLHALPSDVVLGKNNRSNKQAGGKNKQGKKKKEDILGLNKLGENLPELKELMGSSSSSNSSSSSEQSEGPASSEDDSEEEYDDFVRKKKEKHRRRRKFHEDGDDFAASDEDQNGDEEQDDEWDEQHKSERNRHHARTSKKVKPLLKKRIRKIKDFTGENATDFSGLRGVQFKYEPKNINYSYWRVCHHQAVSNPFKDKETTDSFMDEKVLSDDEDDYFPEGTKTKKKNLFQADTESAPEIKQNRSELLKVVQDYPILPYIHPDDPAEEKFERAKSRALDDALEYKKSLITLRAEHIKAIAIMHKKTGQYPMWRRKYKVPAFRQSGYPGVTWRKGWFGDGGNNAKKEKDKEKEQELLHNGCTSEDPNPFSALKNNSRSNSKGSLMGTKYNAAYGKLVLDDNPLNFSDDDFADGRPNNKVFIGEQDENHNSDVEDDDDKNDMNENENSTKRKAKQQQFRPPCWIAQLTVSKKKTLRKLFVPQISNWEYDQDKIEEEVERTKQKAIEWRIQQEKKHLCYVYCTDKEKAKIKKAEELKLKGEKELEEQEKLKKKRKRKPANQNEMKHGKLFVSKNVGGTKRWREGRYKNEGGEGGSDDGQQDHNASEDDQEDFQNSDDEEKENDSENNEAHVETKADQRIANVFALKEKKAEFAKQLQAKEEEIAASFAYQPQLTGKGHGVRWIWSDPKKTSVRTTAAGTCLPLSPGYWWARFIDSGVCFLDEKVYPVKNELDSERLNYEKECLAAAENNDNHTTTTTKGELSDKISIKYAYLKHGGFTVTELADAREKAIEKVYMLQRIHDFDPLKVAGRRKSRNTTNSSRQSSKESCNSDKVEARNLFLFTGKGKGKKGPIKGRGKIGKGVWRKKDGTIVTRGQKKKKNALFAALRQMEKEANAGEEDGGTAFSEVEDNAKEDDADNDNFNYSDEENEMEVDENHEIYDNDLASFEDNSGFLGNNSAGFHHLAEQEDEEDFETKFAREQEQQSQNENNENIQFGEELDEFFNEKIDGEINSDEDIKGIELQEQSAKNKLFSTTTSLQKQTSKSSSFNPNLETIKEEEEVLEFDAKEEKKISSPPRKKAKKEYLLPPEEEDSAEEDLDVMEKKSSNHNLRGGTSASSSKQQSKGRVSSSSAISSSSKNQHLVLANDKMNPANDQVVAAHDGYKKWSRVKDFNYRAANAKNPETGTVDLQIGKSIHDQIGIGDFRVSRHGREKRNLFTQLTTQVTHHASGVSVVKRKLDEQEENAALEDGMEEQENSESDSESEDDHQESSGDEDSEENENPDDNEFEGGADHEVEDEDAARESDNEDDVENYDPHTAIVAVDDYDDRKVLAPKRPAPLTKRQKFKMIPKMNAFDDTFAGAAKKRTIRKPTEVTQHVKKELKATESKLEAKLRQRREEQAAKGGGSGGKKKK